MFHGHDTGYNVNRYLSVIGTVPGTMILSRSSVVGIDLGNEKVVACVARNQKLEILVNTEGARRTESMVPAESENAQLSMHTQYVDMHLVKRRACFYLPRSALVLSITWLGFISRPAPAHWESIKDTGGKQLQEYNQVLETFFWPQL